MDWDDLRFFLALSRERAVSRAGQVLGVNHTTVARRVAALEADLGTRLFEKTADGYEMTQAGENMYSHALAVEESVQAIDREVFGRDAELEGPLKLTVAYDVAIRLIVPWLPEFRERFPNIDLQLLTTTGLVDLAAREADIAVRLTPKPPDYLVGRKVLPLMHGVYGASDYRKRGEERVDVVLYREDPELPPWVANNFPDARVAMRVDDVETMLAAVRNGLGLARMPCYIGDSDSSVRRIELDLVPSTWGIWVLSHVDLRSTARVRVAREFLFDIIERQRALVLGESSRYRQSKAR